MINITNTTNITHTTNTTKFQLGDRVQCIRDIDNHPTKNVHGTVIDYTIQPNSPTGTRYLIKFDTNINGWGDPTLNIPSGHGYFVDEVDLAPADGNYEFMRKFKELVDEHISVSGMFSDNIPTSQPSYQLFKKLGYNITEGDTSDLYIKNEAESVIMITYENNEPEITKIYKGDVGIITLLEFKAIAERLRERGLKI